MTASEFREVGEALYGPYWQGALAADLGVNTRTVRRWVSGANRVPAVVVERLSALALGQSVALARLAYTL